MQKYPAMDAKAYIAYIIVCLTWGATYLAMRIGVQDLPPALFGGVRFLIAGMAMLAYVLIRKQELPKTAREYAIIAVVGLFLLFGGNGLVVWSEQYIPSGFAALIVSIVPLFVAIIEYIIPGGSRMGWKGWVGLLIGFAGVGVLVYPQSGIEAMDLRGIIGMLAASLLWAAGSVVSARYSISGSMLAVSALQTLAGGVALTLTGLMAGELASFHLTPRGAGAILYLIIGGSILGYSCFLYILKAMPPAKASTYTYVNPVVALFLGWLVLGESFGLRQMAAAIIILSGVMMVQVSRFAPSPATENPDRMKGG